LIWCNSLHGFIAVFAQGQKQYLSLLAGMWNPTVKSWFVGRQ
jgi:hypothetical protein